MPPCWPWRCRKGPRAKGCWCPSTPGKARADSPRGRGREPRPAAPLTSARTDFRLPASRTVRGHICGQLLQQPQDPGAVGKDGSPASLSSEPALLPCFAKIFKQHFLKILRFKLLFVRSNFRQRSAQYILTNLNTRIAPMLSRHRTDPSPPSSWSAVPRRPLSWISVAADWFCLPLGFTYIKAHSELCVSLVVLRSPMA